ncbi:MAG: hypothetical protein JNK17_05715 [Hydrogenophaga sp.]|nr:hypothetical protein [Hydrogenophaga sp.]
MVDALSRATDITRDAMGHPTVIVQSVTGGKTRRTELRYDLTGTTFNATDLPNASKGRLSEMVDKVDGVVHATTQYQWDAFGRLTRQTQTLSSAIANHSNTLTTSYAYSTGNGKGQLATITYPSGTVLTHQHAANGLLTGMLWGGKPLLQNIDYNALGQLTSFQAMGTSPVFQWGHTYSYGPIGNRTGGTITANGASMSFTSLLGKTLAYDAAGQLAEATAVPPCPTGTNCLGAQTTLSRFNGWGQRYLRDTPATQSVFSYGMEGHNLLSETTRYLSTSALSTTEHIYLPTASGPMPVAVVINGVHYAVHSDHLNTPRRLTDANKVVKWQWPYSGFGEIAPQATPATGQAAISYALRYPGQIDDGNGLFYNWNRFYDPRVGRYTSADPIGLEGGWNRFGYVGGNPLGFVDPEGLQVNDPTIDPVMGRPCAVQCNDIAQCLECCHAQARKGSLTGTPPSATGHLFLNCRATCNAQLEPKEPSPPPVWCKVLPSMCKTPKLPRGN